jgi:hypothetical protein
MTHYDEWGYAKEKDQGKDCKMSGHQADHIEDIDERKSRTSAS